MDQGARYYRCDFQVHTPRDLNWKGSQHVSDDERRAYAAGFIAACRARRLDAVAITDHHDLCFFPHIRAAAEGEVDGDGNPVPTHLRVVVFPGMELTLAVPCQALLIFDADLPVEHLPSLYPLLGVTQNGPEHAKHVPTERLDPFPDFEALADALDRVDYLRGRYIILPNVTDGGSASMMRLGFTSIYKAMHCVGGYLDGPVSAVGDGTKRILDGKVEAYGRRKLGLFQTSDNRCGKFTELGRHTSWVKWATPTAEALRQACLASDTRIAHAEPETPSKVIPRLEVSDSKFLGVIDLRLNPQYSCLIGGRGTGKSTILEYLRWALCDQPPGYADEDDAASYHEKRASLIEKTLASHGGVVNVSFLLNSVEHVVRRSSLTKEVSLRIGADDFRPCAEADVRDMLPLQAYSQKQLSAVGVRADELVRFIRTPVKADLDRIGNEIGHQRSRIKDLFSAFIQKRRFAREQERDELELSSLSQRVAALRDLQGVPAEDRELLAGHDLYLQEEQVVEKMDRELASIREMADAFRDSLAALPSATADLTGMPNSALVGRLKAALAGIADAAKGNVDATLELLAESSPAVAEYSALRGRWREAFDAHDARYERVKHDASAHEAQINQIGEA